MLVHAHLIVELKAKSVVTPRGGRIVWELPATVGKPLARAFGPPRSKRPLATARAYASLA